MRKDVLLGSTALIAGGLVTADAAVAEEPLRLDISGYRNEYFAIGAVDHDTVDFNNTGHFSDGEVQFSGETTLDNGLSVGVVVQLEAFTTGDQIDENYAYVQGSFGRIQLGSTNNTGPYEGFWSVTAPYAGVPLNSGWITVFVPPAPGSTAAFVTPALTTNVEIVDSDNIISYYSPRFNGFQFTASYVPTALMDGEGKSFPAQANVDSERHNGFAVGLDFQQSFNALDFAWAGAFNHIGGCDAVCADSGDDDSIWQVKSGIDFGYAGFSFGGSFAYEDSSRASEGWSADAGISYSTGPWGVSLTGFVSEVEGAAGGDQDELVSAAGAVSYALGPGIGVSASVLYGDWDDEAGGDSSGIMFVTGMTISY